MSGTSNPGFNLRVLSRYIASMQITSGILKGRQFDVPKNGVRPTTGRTREAVFSSLAARVPGARVLDLFAGAGGYSLEAWSRGAAGVTAVEKNSNVWKNLLNNFLALEAAAGLGTREVVRADVYDYLKRAAGPFEFDLIFADPPYDTVDLPKLLEAVGDTLAADGLLVFEMHKRDPVDISKDWKLLKQKTYGSTQVLFLGRTL
jgi:16S rRNA (guanine966-N2)-methyltransferase